MIKITNENMDKIYTERWVEQSSTIPGKVSLEEFDELIASTLDLGIKNLLAINGTGVMAFKNVFIVNDKCYGGICGECGGDYIAIVVDRGVDIPQPNEQTIWMPSIENLASKGFIPTSTDVFPVDARLVKDKKVYYKCLSCSSSKWYYLEYNSIFGLTYGQEQVDCIANNDNLVKSFGNRMTVEKLNKTYPKGSFLIINDTKENVESGNLDYIYSWCDSLLNGKYTHTYKIMLCIDGYDNDPRELWQIEEFNNYIKKLVQEKPFFTSIIDNKSLIIISVCGVGSNRNNDGVHAIEIDNNKLINLVEESMTSLISSDRFDDAFIKKCKQDYNVTLGTNFFRI